MAGAKSREIGWKLVQTVPNIIPLVQRREIPAKQRRRYQVKLGGKTSGAWGDKQGKPAAGTLFPCQMTGKLKRKLSQT